MDLLTQSIWHIISIVFNSRFEAGKLGMWLSSPRKSCSSADFSAPYAVYRYNHPEVFVYAHHFLDTNLGAINTCVLLFSSLTMAWGVRCAQLGQRKGLILCLWLTILCGFRLYGIKYMNIPINGMKDYCGEPVIIPVKKLLSMPSAMGRKVEIFPTSWTGQCTYFFCNLLLSDRPAWHSRAGGHWPASVVIDSCIPWWFSPENFTAVDFIGLYWILSIWSGFSCSHFFTSFTKSSCQAYDLPSAWSYLWAVLPIQHLCIRMKIPLTWGGWRTLSSWAGPYFTLADSSQGLGCVDGIDHPDRDGKLGWILAAWTSWLPWQSLWLRVLWLCFISCTWNTTAIYRLHIHVFTGVLLHSSWEWWSWIEIVSACRRDSPTGWYTGYRFSSVDSCSPAPVK